MSVVNSEMADLLAIDAQITNSTVSSEMADLLALDAQITKNFEHISTNVDAWEKHISDQYRLRKQINATRNSLFKEIANLEERIRESNKMYDGNNTSQLIDDMVLLRSLHDKADSMSKELRSVTHEMHRLEQGLYMCTKDYAKLLCESKLKLESLPDSSQKIVRNLFWWGKLKCGICIHHQLDKCRYGDWCYRAHIPKLKGYPYVNITAILTEVSRTH